MPVLETLLATLVAEGKIIQRGDQVGLPSGPELTNRQRTLLDTVLSELKATGPTPPTLKELAEQHKYPLQDLDLLIQVAVDRGRLIRLSPQMAIDREALNLLRQKLATHFQTHQTGTVGEIREQWQMTRKHTVPILEFFDKLQITSRAGDSRSAGPHIGLPIDEVPA
jgi:selenocysteine-specific elongation factor